MSGHIDFDTSRSPTCLQGRNLGDIEMNTVRVVCVAPGRTVRGGISRLIEKIEYSFPTYIEFKVVPSCSNSLADIHPLGWIIFKQMGRFLSCLLYVLYRGVFTRSTIFHLHFSHRGSTLRKGIICIMLRALNCTYVIHGHANDDAIVHTWLPRVVKRALFWGLRGARNLIALTPLWRQYYINAGIVTPDNVVVLPNPAQIPHSLPQREGRDYVNFLFLGQIGTRKGTFELITAFVSLPFSIRNRCHLTIAGDGEVEQARARLAEAEREGTASVLGWVNGDRVDQLLAQADVLFLPSRAEGMSMALLEGMAWGLAVVTTSVGGASDFLLDDQNCIIVKAGDVQGIADAMERLIQNRDLRHKLGREASNTAKRFGVDQYVKRLSDFYLELSGVDISIVPHGLNGTPLNEMHSQ